ncbi:MAG: GNAT family N-acetyltransferase [Flavobacteriaceae bacterium]|nr:GNAT family N-acetyltransferase [Flavobacteriaceae bacterium]
MNRFLIKPIKKSKITSIIPLLRLINKSTPKKILQERLLEMVEQNYECIGLFDEDKLIGICGLWYSTRHYIGKSAEVDHVLINNDYRNQGLGKFFFKWIYKYLREKGCEGTELNTFTGNRKSHKFYYNEGYEIYGFHMVKVLRDNGEFY